jgi:uncharacterized protein (DUF1697 family)
VERYVAFLRGVSPMNCKMPELKRSFEAAGFADVCTLLSSGNVAFSATPAVVPDLEAQAEGAMERLLGKTFLTIVRPSAFLRAVIAHGPFTEFDLPPNAKPVVTFLRRPHDRVIEVPVRQGQAAILRAERTEVFSAYVPDEKGPVFMSLLERTFGKDITTRTLETVRKCSVA